MNYMPILPIGMQDLQVSCDCRNIFVLPQYWENLKYRTFYTSHKWVTAIIDNGMYELPEGYSFDYLIDIALGLQANQIFIVPPEDFHDSKRTVELCKETIAKYGACGSKWQIMMILHGNSLEDVKSQIEETKEQVQAYGVAVKLSRKGIRREDIIRFVNPHLYYLHAMGLDDLMEVRALRAVGYRSIDTSMAATAAVNKIDLSRARGIFRTGSSNDPKRVDLLQEKFPITQYRETYHNVMSLKQLIEGI